MSSPASTAAPAVVTTPRQQYSLGHLTIIDVPTPELVRIAAACGYDFVSPRMITGGLPGPDYSLADNPDLLARVRRALSETGIPIHDIELARIADGIDVADYRRSIAIGAELGARKLISSIWATDRAFGVDSFGRLCRLAAEYDMTVGLEFVPIATVAGLADALNVLDEVAAPNARLMVDLHHLHRARCSLSDLDRVPREWFEFAQICDAPGEIPTERGEMTRIIRAGRDYLGEGGTDPRAMLAHLPPMVYTLEIPSAEQVAQLGAEGHARRCLETTRAYLGNAA